MVWRQGRLARAILRATFLVAGVLVGWAAYNAVAGDGAYATEPSHPPPSASTTDRAGTVVAGLTRPSRAPHRQSVAVGRDIARDEAGGAEVEQAGRALPGPQAGPRQPAGSAPGVTVRNFTMPGSAPSAAPGRRALGRPAAVVPPPAAPPPRAPVVPVRPRTDPVATDPGPDRAETPGRSPGAVARPAPGPAIPCVQGATVSSAPARWAVVGQRFTGGAGGIGAPGGDRPGGDRPGGAVTGADRLPGSAPIGVGDVGADFHGSTGAGTSGTGALTGADSGYRQWEPEAEYRAGHRPPGAELAGRSPVPGNWPA